MGMGIAGVDGEALLCGVVAGAESVVWIVERQTDVGINFPPGQM